MMSQTTNTDAPQLEAIRQVLAQHGRFVVDAIQYDDDLYRAGLTSLATVGVMLALEERFDIEFPESKLGRATFRSIETIAEAIREIKTSRPAG